MRRITVIWLAIALIAASLLFPPYGYSAYKTFTGVIRAPLAGQSESQTNIPWRYVGYTFLFADPPKTDPRLKRSKSDGITYSVYEITNMGIGWHIIAIEVLLIALGATGVIITMALKKPKLGGSR